MKNGKELIRRHQRIGWYSLALFLALGLFLEAMHGLKIGFYLEDPIRRQQWTLAHAHGTLVAVIHLLFSSAIGMKCFSNLKRLQSSSLLLTLSLVLLPGGFFLGGFGTSESDPGPGIWFVPVGGLLLIIAVLVTAGQVDLTGGEESPS